MPKYNPRIHKRRSFRLKGYDYSLGGLFFVTICIRNRLSLFGEVQNGKMKLNHAGEMIDKWYHELENKFPDVKCHAHIIMPNHFHCIIENAVGADLCVCQKSPPSNPSPESPSTNNKQTTLHDANPSLHDVNPSLHDANPSSNEINPSPDVNPSSNEINPSPDLHSSSDAAHKISPNNGINSISDSSETREVSPVVNYAKPTMGERMGGLLDDTHRTQLTKPTMGEHTGSPLHEIVQWFKTMTTNEYIRNVKSNDWKRFDKKLWQRNYWEYIIRNERSYKNISKYIINNPKKWNEDTFNGR